MPLTISTPFADLRGLVLAGIDREVLELVGPLDVAGRPDLHVLENLAVLDDAACAPTVP